MASRTRPDDRQPLASTPDLNNTRQRILRAAARLFRERGYHATTTRAISEIVGILSGSLFHYFRSKEEMLFEVMNQAATELCEKAEAAVAAAVDDPRARLRALVRLQLDCLLGEDTRDFYSVLIAEWRELDSAAKPVLRARRTQYARVWQTALDDCARMGVLRSDAHATLFVLHGAINWATTWFKPEGRLSREDFAVLLEDLVLERRPAAAT
jgi:TetR/AcrR family transcriptional regulator, cholesterol catabolism regulator